MDAALSKILGFDHASDGFADVSHALGSLGAIAFTAGAATTPAGIYRLELASGRVEQLSPAQAAPIPPAYVASPEPIEFPTGRGDSAHALLYRPRNPDFAAPTDERPPLIVISHGGPTGATLTALNPGIQFWTSRGFAVVDVNYGGSSGYGRPYRERLHDQWGIVDVQDCVAAARWLVERDVVDGRRLAIRGGSAGGYTTLAALTFHRVFSAGASHFGISDLEAMTAETHKFESRYLDGLVGPYPARRDVYRERSPLHFIDQLAVPLILFQGLDDKVVPPNQAEMMRDALERKGLPVAYVTFAGEGHGFRKAENIVRALEAELYFYSRVFGFALAEPVEPVPIANLPTA
jgi:dipeptidyl aminopeptidase/acylaminoacyl peptidase